MYKTFKIGDLVKHCADSPSDPCGVIDKVYLNNRWAWVKWNWQKVSVPHPTDNLYIVKRKQTHPNTNLFK